MKFERHIPKEVRTAQRRGDREALSAMGKAGNKRKEELGIMDELARERAEQAEAERRRSSNEHLSPPPGPFD